jgi:hypothetical protein
MMSRGLRERTSRSATRVADEGGIVLDADRLDDRQWQRVLRGRTLAALEAALATVEPRLATAAEMLRSMALDADDE